MFDDKKKVKIGHVEKNEIPTVDDKIEDVIYVEPDMFLAEAIVVLRELPLATRRRKARELAMEASLYETQSQLSNNRYAQKAWGNVTWKLRTLK
tara:strand:- start:217 stop:498 length:282 start_codon:yes stop_codon:yes gene_type:complete